MSSAAQVLSPPDCARAERGWIGWANNRPRASSKNSLAVSDITYSPFGLGRLLKPSKRFVNTQSSLARVISHKFVRLCRLAPPIIKRAVRKISSRTNIVPLRALQLRQCPDDVVEHALDAH